MTIIQRNTVFENVLALLTKAKSNTTGPKFEKPNINKHASKRHIGTHKQSLCDDSAV